MNYRVLQLLTELQREIESELEKNEQVHNKLAQDTALLTDRINELMAENETLKNKLDRCGELFTSIGGLLTK